MKVELPRSAPEAQGIPSAAITAFVDAVERDGLELHGLVLLRHGHVVAQGWWQPYRAELPRMLFSLSKSFTSTAVGFAVTEGLLRLDDKLLDYFPEYKATHTGLWERLTLQHMLMMGTGHETDTMEAIMNDPDGNWAAGFFATPLVYEPGTHFLYNTGSSYMLSAVVQKVTGQRLLDYLTPRLLEPLGIEGAMWEQCPRGVDTGGFGLAIRTEDIARFGQFLLQRGCWQGKQLIPAAWIDEATAKHIDNGPNDGADWAQGYGYQFWRCVPQGVYRGDGAFGQYCIVSPKDDIVLAINSGLGDMQAVMKHAWQLFSAVGDTLPEDDAAHKALQARLTGLHYAPPTENRDAARESQVNDLTYRFTENPLGYRTIRFRFAEDGCILNVENDEGSHGLDLGSGRWAIGADTGLVALPLGPDNTLAETAAAFAWQQDGSLQLIIRRVQSPFVLTMAVSFDGDALALRSTANVSFGSTDLPVLTATAT